MLADILGFFQYDFGTKAAALVAIGFCSLLPFCIRKRIWPDVGATIIMLFGVIAAAIGVRIIALALLLPITDLGALSDERYTLVIGGIVTFIVSLRESFEHWQAIIRG